MKHLTQKNVCEAPTKRFMILWFEVCKKKNTKWRSSVNTIMIL